MRLRSRARRASFVLMAMFLSAASGATAGGGGSPEPPLVSHSPSVFLKGEVPRDTVRVVAVTVGPTRSRVRAAWLSRVARFWIPTRCCRVDELPSFYQLNASCPSCNGLTHCEHRLDLAQLNTMLVPYGLVLGPDYLRQTLSIPAADGDCPQRQAIADQIWDHGKAEGVYRIRENAVRINSQAVFYHLVELPPVAPDGTYHVTSVFFSTNGVLGITESEFVLHRRGASAWLTRLSTRDGWLYGLVAVLLAVILGWVTAGGRPSRLDSPVTRSNDPS